ncbi:site-specific DNA-methyltransferase [Macrococcus caseolyticus]|uniref:DNA-methyltransferase n=1 Tax=Macrococcoides caseolyticum TaxID=69966 RepID=UPI002DB7592D|nr:site-specific DNA-methyltransferase [Macrococcus caseolyticus]MEB8171641.1 site-specific DNA-methyltransferase [Macrococcus caseolyticus]
MYNFNRTYQENCDFAMKKLIDNNIKFDLILTDPPYNLNKDFGNNSDSLELDEFIQINKKRISMCHQLLDKNGSLIWFGIHRYIGYLQILMYEENLFYRSMYIWHYENGFSRSKKIPANQYEPFLWFSNNNKKWIYNADDVRVPYKSSERLKTPIYYKDAKGVKKQWQPNPLGALRGDIWSFPTLSGNRFKKERTSHPTQKPESLITELIKAHCPKNKEGQYEGTILDPFHGSGTLGVCCEKLNKQGHNIKWLGFELENKWVEISNERIEKIKKD